MMWSVDGHSRCCMLISSHFFFLVLAGLNKLLIIFHLFLSSFSFSQTTFSNHEQPRHWTHQELAWHTRGLPSKGTSAKLAAKDMDRWLKPAAFSFFRALCSRTCSLFSKTLLLSKLSSVTLSTTSTLPIPKRSMLLLVSNPGRVRSVAVRKIDPYGRSRCSWFLVWPLDCSSFGCCFCSRA